MELEDFGVGDFVFEGFEWIGVVIGGAGGRNARFARDSQRLGVGASGVGAAAGLIQHAAQEQVWLPDRWIDLNDFQKGDHSIFKSSLAISRDTQRQSQLRIVRISRETGLYNLRSRCEIATPEENLRPIKCDMWILLSR